MKAARLILTILAVIAVVGGALAFKAKAFSSFPLYCNDSNNKCQTQINGFTNSNQGQGSTSTPCGSGITHWSFTKSTSGSCGSTGTVFTTTD